MAEIWGSKVNRFADQIGCAPTVAEKLRTLQELLTEEEAMLERPCRDGVMIFEFIRADKNQEAHKIKALRDRLGVSERTLRRRCRELFGYGPKTLQRILRMQRVLWLLSCPRAPHTLALLAQAAGFADQAHLTRVFRDATGETPAVYRSRSSK